MALPSVTTLVATPIASVCGQPVTFTATVTPLGATGTVDFIISDNGPTITVPLDASGQASVTLSDLSVGPHVATAVYSGDATYDPSVAPPVTQTVTPALTTSAVSVTGSVVCGQPLTASVSVVPVPPATGTPTGTVTVSVLAGPTVTGTLGPGGTVDVTIPGLPAGVQVLTVVYAGDGCFAGSTSTALTVTVAAAPTTTTVVASPNPAVCGQPVTLTATVAPVLPGGTPTGTVTFTVAGDGPPLTAPVGAGGVATVTTPSLDAGPYVVTAVYSGDTCFLTSTAVPVPLVVDLATTTTTVTASPTPAVCGQPVTLTATVASTPAGTPGGTVTFTVTGDGPPITVPVGPGGVATATTPALTAGTHTVTAVYSGDTCYATSTSVALPVVVSQATTTTTVVASPTPAVCGQPVTLTATVVSTPAGTPTGTVTFTVTGDGPPITAPVGPGGVATATTPALTAGPHTVTAVYSGDDCFATSTSAPLPLTVTQATTTTTVTASPTPPVCGQPVTLTATVATTPPGGTPTGTVTFTITGDGPPITAPVGAGGVATATTPALSAGAHTVTAVYSGDPCFATSTSTPLVLTVTQTSTTTTVTASPTPAVCGQPVTLTATVATTPPGGTPTGTVTFTITGDGPPITAPVGPGGTVTVTTPALPAGSHTVTAVYSGDACYATSTSAPLPVPVAQTPTTTTVTASPAAPVCGQPTTLTATVTSSGSGTPTGNVVFFISNDGPSVTVPLNASGQASTTVTLTPGPHTVTALYFGDACFLVSVSTAITLTPTTVPTTTTLTSSPNPSTVGQPVTFTAVVAPTLLGSGTPTGTVTFTISGGPTLTAPVNASGQASVTTSVLTEGPHVVVATYNPTGCFGGSNSAPLTQNVTPTTTPPSETTLTAAPATIRVRTNGQFVIPVLSATLTHTGGAPIAGQTITFTANPVTGPVTLGTAVTNASGVATLTNVPVSPTLITTHQYRASFAGAPGLDPDSDTAPLYYQPSPLLP